MNKLAIMLGGIALGISFNASAQSAIVAQAGSATVTQAEVATFIESLSPENRQRLAADPAQLDLLVRSQLATKTMFNEAKAKGWDQQPKVKLAVEQAEREAVVHSYLNAMSTPPENYPSEADMRAAYAQHQGAFKIPRMEHLAQVYISAAPDGGDAALGQARKTATDVAHKAQAPGADFAALARASSQDRISSARGGDLGFISGDQMVPAVRQSTDAAKQGDVVGPIQTSDGFYIIKVLEVHPAGEAPYEQVKGRIRQTLRQERSHEIVQAYMAKSVGPATVKIDEAALGKALSFVQ
jgi:parvulin-like peptidyl-prolyl isomerase